MMIFSRKAWALLCQTVAIIIVTITNITHHTNCEIHEKIIELRIISFVLISVRKDSIIEPSLHLMSKGL